jgi:NADPH:quinone reductase-like Zn-dependent oxidoreductase
MNASVTVATARKIEISRPGGYDRLQVKEVPLPEPKAREVLVETRAIGVNFADVVVRMGLYSSAREYVGWPITPGFEYAGVVTEVGPEVTRVRPGDHVVGVTRFGAYASHVCVDESLVFPLPEGLPLREAGALLVMSLTAWYALCELCKLRPGMRVLVHSAAGGVGSALVQIAKIYGCQVFGVVGSPHKVSLVRELGADRVVDKSTQDLWAEARAFAPEGFDVVLDANGVETLKKSYAALRPTGRLIVYGFHSMLSPGRAKPNWLKLVWEFVRMPRFSPLQLTDDNRAVLAFNLSYLFDRQEEMQEGVTQILQWVREGKLRVPCVSEYPLDEVGQAHAALQSGQTRGKLVLVP